MPEVEVSCAFCGLTVVETDHDPIGIGVVERWRHNQDIDWMVYAHRLCLLSRLAEEVREAVEQ